MVSCAHQMKTVMFNRTYKEVMGKAMSFILDERIILLREDIEDTLEGEGVLKR